MGHRARAVEVGVFEALAARPVPRHVTEAVGRFLFSIHLILLRDSTDAVAAGGPGGRRLHRSAGMATEKGPGVAAAAALVLQAAAIAL